MPELFEQSYWRLFGWGALNFATPVCFFVTFHAIGAKPAIGFAVSATIIQILIHFLRKISLSPYFIVASGFTLIFGSIDLFLHQPKVFRFEPFAQNFFVGSIFLTTVFTRIPIAYWFAQALPKRFRPNLMESGHSYLRKVTLVWSIYLYLKSLLFLYFAFEVSLGDLILLRSIIGSITLFLMFAGEIAYRTNFQKK